MRQIAIIGAGELGSRHLQALAKLAEAATITVVDPSEISLRIARDRFNEIASGPWLNILFVKNLNSLPETLDLAIVATSSAVRMAVISQLLAITTVSTLILEKVLFQKNADFDDANELFLQKKISAWVNCPRRMMPFFKKLAEYISPDQPFTFTAEGSNWGLCCNAIHLIDNCAMYSRCTEYALDLSGLYRSIVRSKREGFIELNGTLKGRFSNGAQFELRCEDGDQWWLINRIQNAAHLIEINLKENAATITQLATAEKTFFANITVRQSELTHMAVQDLFASGECELTRFQDSVALHRPLINDLLSYVNTLLPTPTDALAIT